MFECVYTEEVYKGEFGVLGDISGKKSALKQEIFASQQIITDYFLPARESHFVFLALQSLLLRKDRLESLEETFSFRLHKFSCCLCGKKKDRLVRIAAAQSISIMESKAQ